MAGQLYFSDTLLFRVHSLPGKHTWLNGVVSQEWKLKEPLVIS